MGKILISLAITILVSLLSILYPEPGWMIFVLTIYLVNGFFRKYQGEYQPFAIIGVLHNALALFLTYLVGIFSYFALSIHGQYLPIAIFAVAFGFFYQFGFEKYLARVLIGLPFWFLWAVGAIWMARYCSEGLDENLALFASLLLFGVYFLDLCFVMFEKLCSRY